MRTTIIFLFSIILMLCGLAKAHPNPDKLGMCYVFNKDDFQKVVPCVVATGSGAGALYQALYWPDGKKTYVEENTMTSPFPVSVDGQPAERYNRDGYWYQ